MTTDLTPMDAHLDLAMRDIAGQLAPSSRRVYLIDARHFADWMREQGLTPEQMTRSHLIAYRQFLAETTQQNGKPYSKSSLQRMFAVACRLMREQAITSHLADITQEVKGFKVQGETTHTALSKSQAREMLNSIDTSTAKGARDHALLLLLIKTGIRRAECVALNQSDIKVMDGHHVAVIEHGKGDKKRVVKLRVDVFRALETYINAVHLPDGPLFVAFNKSDRPTGRRLTDKTVERLVKHYAPAHTKLTPHGLRATFATVALESGATLHQVQYALGHADPRTTERYQKRKLNLDENAVDVLNF